MGLLATINNFGGVAAEDDNAILSYFLKTSAVDRISNGKHYAVIGRKGSGKTALTKYFSQPFKDRASSAPTLRDYPWNVHQKRRNLGASDIESYVTSWRYLIAVKLISTIIEQKGAKNLTDSQRAAREFLNDNFGGINPSLTDIIRPNKLSIKRTIIAPFILGNSLGSVELENQSGGLPDIFDTVTDALLKTATILVDQAGIECAQLHFDELDQGLSELDKTRKEMITGLILAIRSIRSGDFGQKLRPVFYIRTDLWDNIDFSDKNKISQSSSVYLDWDSESLKKLINERLKTKLAFDASWEDINDGLLMRGSQAKWSHIISRTFHRPRDVIQFLNCAIDKALIRDLGADKFTNDDIQSARETYSKYLKQELDDEIIPHWKHWKEALQTFSDISTLNFSREEFSKAYHKRKTKVNPIEADEALAILYSFSVIGYRRSIGGGGSGWVFQYSDPEAGWDSVSTKLKVHSGLKEFAKLREGRAA